MKFEISTLEALPKVAKAFIRHFAEQRIFAFVGDMGAGKTTFIHAICKELNVSSKLSSPTYSIVNEYVTDDGLVLYHFDAYRLETQEEALDFGFEEYLESGNYCFIEWPDKVSGLLPEETLVVRLKAENNQRIISVQEA